MSENSATPETTSPTPPPAGQPYGMNQPYVAKRVKKRKGVRVWVVVLLVILGVLVGTLVGNNVRANPYLTFQDSIGVIDLDGTIGQDDGANTPEGLLAQLQSAANDPSIKAVVLRVNSGGGAAAAGEEMAQYVKDFSKPIVVSTASGNASAAYLISSQADYIYTAKTTAIGAIGTVMQVTDLSGLMEKLGISVDNVTSADSKDSSYGTRPLTEEERAYYQDQVDQINETFIQTVAEGRDMPVEDVRALATGLTFTGMTAVENGLADEIGTKDDAVAKAAELANIAHYTTVTLKNPTSSLSSLLDLMSKSNVSTDDIARALKELDTDGSIAQ